MPREIDIDNKIQIHTSIHITRRKQMNVVTDDHGEPLWTGASIFDACRWCLDNEHYTVSMHKDGEYIRLMLGEPTE